MSRNKKVPVTAERIRTLRLQAGLSQQEMGRIVGASKSSLSEYENGDTHISVDILMKYCEYFHVDLNYLTGAAEGKADRSIPMFTGTETMMILNYRQKSNREQKIMRLQAMSDEEYDSLYSSHEYQSQPALMSDQKEKGYPAKGKKKGGKK